MTERTAETTRIHDMVLTRVFDAPVERLWRAWTEDDQVTQWWGPQGFTAPLARMDMREGGTSLVCMRSADLGDIYNTWTYTTIAPMERLEFVSRFSDEQGTVLDPRELGLPPGVPAEVPHVVTFLPVGEGTTRLTVREIGYSDPQIVEVSRLGMAQCLDKMAVLVAGG
jgi:uncharacterized protein YndB with AHSA1/START domain